jgi:hypothetical protein
MGKPHTSESRRRISRGLRRYHQRKREAARVRPRDLQRLRKSGTVSESLRPLLEIAEQESSELLEALGGVEHVSPQRRVLVEDAVAVGMVLRAELARYLQAGDADAGARVGSLANARRASLAALGLERHAREVDLQAYLAAKGTEKSHHTVEDVAKSTIDTEAESSSALDGESRTESDVERAP